MLKFFREENQTGALKINPGYWAEKVIDGTNGGRVAPISPFTNQWERAIAA
jgi:hypothetical protein